MPDRDEGPAGLASAAPDVAALAARYADDADATGELHPDVVAAILEAGFARHFVPRYLGGSGGTFAELSGAVAVLGEKCAATAWSASVLASLSRMAAWLPPQGRAEIWKDGPDVPVAGSVSPRGRGRPEGDGWSLTGTWPYVSVVEHAEWILLLAVVPGQGERPQPRVFAVPRSAVQVQKTWSDIGMRATGSHTVTVTDGYVPDALSFPAARLFESPAPQAEARCHDVPLNAVNGLFFGLPMLGAARGALAVWSAYAAEKVLPGRAGPGPAKEHYEQVLARSSGEIDAAELLLLRIAERADRGPQPGPAELTRAQRDSALAADLLLGAADRLFRSSGTSGHSTTSPLQRLWRDLHSAASHVVLQFGPAATAYADAHLAAPGAAATGRTGGC